MLVGGIEAGGTKFICGVAQDPPKILSQAEIPTTSPEETLARVIAFFQRAQLGHGKLSALGIASFGPLDLVPGSPTYGFITHTPKTGWSMTDLVGIMGGFFDLPVGFDTDVNGAALAEHLWGAAKELDTFVYLTVGTGIGGGGMAGGHLLHGLVHPEMGHLRIPHDWQKDPFTGICPYHRDCLEGLASGPALEKRWGVSGAELPADHPAWLLEAEYLSFGLVNIICALSPQRVILGGGVMQQNHLFPMIRKRVKALLNDYVQNRAILERIDSFIVPPALGSQAGILGAIALAQMANG